MLRCSWLYLSAIDILQDGIGYCYYSNIQDQMYCFNYYFWEFNWPYNLPIMLFRNFYFQSLDSYSYFLKIIPIFFITSACPFRLVIDFPKETMEYLWKLLMFSMMIYCSISNLETGCSTSGYFNTKYTILLELSVTFPKIYWMLRFFSFSQAQPNTLRISCYRSSCTLDKGLLAFHSGEPSQSKESKSKRLLLESAATDQQLFPNLSNGKEQCVSSEVKLIYVPRQLISIMMHFLPSEGTTSHYLILVSIY